MRAVVLVTTRPGGGPDVVEAVRGDKRFTRCIATLGPCEAVFEVRAVDRDDLLEALGAISECRAQTASETLLDMEIREEDEAPRRKAGRGGIRAVMLLFEDKERGDVWTHSLFLNIRSVGGVVEDAYPVLGRYDDVVWLRGEGLHEITETVRLIQSLEGVRETVTLIEAPF